MKIGKRITALMLIAAMSLVGVGCSSANGDGKSARVNLKSMLKKKQIMNLTFKYFQMSY